MQLAAEMVRAEIASLICSQHPPVALELTTLTMRDAGVSPIRQLKGKLRVLPRKPRVVASLVRRPLHLKCCFTPMIPTCMAPGTASRMQSTSSPGALWSHCQGSMKLIVKDCKMQRQPTPLT